ncbi:MAG: cation:proton antiporter [gamma proteobacterium symbiont of Lucinoma myriamae]|nr:cation:proton antiporter [gamma proteobacterium symbiont of Lucinoma myriamae]MCU7818990.1 cation:proton antiporter [gamma proteobacterium symbiont of Lucinoma myriamae]MCU7833065.1 cation:proton antiporter [gamma proteobacterium symbiont of Lucinoma myriamae]
MDLSWLVISLAETGWLFVTFFLGLMAYKIGLPPMLGFLGVGFILNAYGYESTHELREIADLGVTLMLFTIGLKLDVKSLLRVQIWGVASSHMLITVIVYTGLFFALSFTGLSSFADIDLLTALLIAFALSFSSTVFAVKVLEGKNEMGALYAQLAIGILIVQDIFAVIFLTASMGKVPSVWALGLLALPLVRPLLYKLMDEVEHGELLVLYSLLLAVGGAALFEIVGMKADLGALIFGILLAKHSKASEVSKTLYNFKDLFLVGFFVNIGLSGEPTIDNVMMAGILSILMLAKVVLFFWLLIKTHLRARTAFLSSLSLANYSEFGLIVGAIGVSNGWMSNEWLITIAIALAMTFVIASPVNAAAHELYARYSRKIRHLQVEKRLKDELPVDISGASILVFGMGRIGTGVYDDLNYHFPDKVKGIDFNTAVFYEHEANKRNVAYADVMDKDFWGKISLKDVSMVFLNLPDFEKNLFSVTQLKEKGFQGQISSIALYDSEISLLKEAGAAAVYNFYSEAGIGFAEHVRHNLMNVERRDKREPSEE